MGARESMAFPMAEGGGGGFSWGSLFSNPLVLQMMASMGESLDPEGPAGAMGRVGKEWIRNQSQMKMMEKLLGGGAKIAMDGDKTSITGGSSLLGDLSVDVSETKEGKLTDPNAFSNYIKKMQSQGVGAGAEPSRAINPFVSSQPGTSLADLAGLRGEDINQAMQLMLGQRDISRKSVADIYDAMYKMGILREQQRLTTAQVGEKTPSIKVPGTDIVLTRKEYVDWYKAASKDQRTSAIKDYEYAVSQGYQDTFEDWATQMKKLGRTEINIGDIREKAMVTGKVKHQLKITEPGHEHTIRERLMEADRRGYSRPSGWEELVKKGMSKPDAIVRKQTLMILEEFDKDIRSAYLGRRIERKKDGWYIDGVLTVRNPYYYE